MLVTAIKVLKKIEDKGYKAYIVGGYPRDMYLGRKTVDVDICTNATPKDLVDIFPQILNSEIKYGSATLYFNKVRFEITTFRKDIKYSDNRRPVKIKYIDNLIEDLQRRDFIINTLCLNQEGEVIDILGAKNDLDNKIIKMVGKPKVRLKEDVLRILRAIRFATTLNFKLDSELEKYIIRYGKRLNKLSYERRKDELDKVFSSPNVKCGIDLILKTGLDKYLELSNMDNMVITSSLIGIWAQLDVLDIYKFNKNERKTIMLINELINKDILNNKNLYKYGLYISTVAGEIKGIDRKLITSKFNELYITNKSEIAIKVHDICELLDKKPGCFLSEIIDDIEEKLIIKEIKNEIDILKKYIVDKYCQ